MTPGFPIGTWFLNRDKTEQIMEEIEASILGESRFRFQLETIEENRAALHGLFNQARVTIQLFSWDLDRNLYQDIRLVAALLRFAKATPRSRVQLLIGETRRGQLQGHPLIELSGRLSSVIEVRQLTAQQTAPHGEYALFDNSGMISRPLKGRYFGEACFHSPPDVHRLRKQFLLLWEQAIPASELRALKI